MGMCLIESYFALKMKKKKQNHFFRIYVKWLKISYINKIEKKKKNDITIDY